MTTPSPGPPVVAAPATVASTAPTMTLAIQAVLAAVLAGLIARSVGNEQSLLVAWTAYVVIGASAEASTRRAWTWLAGTVVGATAGVAFAASVPDSIVWTLVVVTVGVFFTIVTAAVSYPAMVFWMNIALVPLFATEGRYLDLITDKAVAAFIGGGVAAIVALTVAPIRLARDLRPAVLAYLDALDAALAAQARGMWDHRATAGAALDRAHSALDSMVASALDKTHLFPQSEARSGAGRLYRRRPRGVPAAHPDAHRLLAAVAQLDGSTGGVRHPPTARRSSGRQDCRGRGRSSRNHAEW